LGIKYQNGNYWLVTSKQNNADVYSRLNKNDLYVLQPDDIINMGELDFLIQRFNCGFHSDRGSRHHMEDIIVIRQQLGVSSRLNVSFFAVFDGYLLKFSKYIYLFKILYIIPIFFNIFLYLYFIFLYLLNLFKFI